MSICSDELKRYHRLNSAALIDSAVFFGSNCFAGIPVGELARDLDVDVPVYNRSIEGLALNEAEKAFEECIYPVSPAKLFVNLGETDLLRDDFETGAFLNAYEWLLYTMNSRLSGKTQIYIVSVLSENPMTQAVNEGLAKLAAETGCVYIDISRAASCENKEVRIFELLRRFLLDRKIRFSEAFRIARHAAI